MAADIYYEDSIAHILEILKLNFGTDIKSYYEGDPLIIGESNLPAITVTKATGSVGLGPTQYDEMTENIVVTIIMNKRDDYGASDNVDLTERKLRKMMEGIDPTTGLYLEQTVMGCLRTNITLQQTSLEHSEQIKYGIVQRSAKEDFWTSEAKLQITLRKYIQIPGRV